MKKIIITLILLVFSIIIFSAEKIHYPLIGVHGLNSNGYIWRNGFFNELKKSYIFEGYFSPSLYSELNNPEKSGIEDFANALKNNHIKSLNKPPILIAHSMGGLISRQYALNSNKLKGIITIGTPHRGANISDKKDWIVFLGLLDAAFCTPLLMDKYPETQWLKNTVAATIGIIATTFLVIALMNLLHLKSVTITFNNPSIFVNYATEIIAGAGILVFLVASAYIATLNTSPHMKQMNPGSAFLKQLNSKKLPEYDTNNKKIFYASIYGERNDVFTLIDELQPGISGKVKTGANTVSITYAGVGAYHISRSITRWFFGIPIIDWYRIVVGSAYLASAASINEIGLRLLYEKIVENSSRGDAVVPLDSQIFPRDVVPKDAIYLKPERAPRDNHLTEITPNSDSLYKTIIIFDKLRLRHYNDVFK
ncbi:hypothetical protein XO10_07350 [Marinitoga sp. 1135]|uniref:esterase/lipase family protein n=1 Tax=Marinitoga sp. 1135 TaxID=1643333 RepID=UPI001585DD0B|nr:alpha/beta fold hydrolase [Marinitoga sp. 1135]NUU96090.1 hypothetical protein [Marinitoga sp. 1135]